MNAFLLTNTKLATWLFSVSEICATYGWGQLDNELMVNKLIAAHFKIKKLKKCRDFFSNWIDSWKGRTERMTCVGFSGKRFCPVRFPEIQSIQNIKY